MIAYRLCRSTYSALSGEGARKFGGRWNLAGTPAVYAAESRALCILERLVHFVRLPNDEAFTRIFIPDELNIVTITSSQLPVGWDNPVESAGAQAMGNELLVAYNALALRVPSIVIPDEYCLVLNPNHEDFSRLQFHAPVPFRYDHRLRRSEGSFPL